MHQLARTFLLGFLAAGMAVAAPAAAQQFSEGYNFLKAVKERDGTKVTAALEKPGTTVVNARDLASGEGALHIVVQRRDPAWLRFLLAKGANPNLADRNGTTPLQLASNFGWSEGVEILVGRGASINTSNSAGETPLISAVHRRDLDLVRVLLKAGADPKRSDNSGRNARDYAVLIGAQNGILGEIDRAAQERAAKAAKTYGPGA